MHSRLPGLWLEIEKSLCKLMDSHLKVSSKENQGSNFYFEIPVCRIYNFDDTLKCHRKELRALCRTSNKTEIFIEDEKMENL